MSAIYEEATSSAHKKRRTFRWSPTMTEEHLSNKTLLRLPRLRNSKIIYLD